MASLPEDRTLRLVTKYQTANFKGGFKMPQKVANAFYCHWAPGHSSSPIGQTSPATQQAEA
jgi:hypothetical protein